MKVYELMNALREFEMSTEIERVFIRGPHINIQRNAESVQKSQPVFDQKEACVSKIKDILWKEYLQNKYFDGYYDN